MAKKPSAPKSAKKKAKKPAPTVAGISSNHPFAPFADQILSMFIAPAIQRVMEGNPTTFTEIHKAYNKITNSRVTAGVLKGWLKQLGWSNGRSWVHASRPAPAFPVDPKAPTAEEPGKRGAAFFDAPPVGPAPDPQDLPDIPTNRRPTVLALDDDE